MTIIYYDYGKDTNGDWDVFTCEFSQVADCDQLKLETRISEGKEKYRLQFEPMKTLDIERFGQIIQKLMPTTYPATRISDTHALSLRCLHNAKSSEEQAMEAAQFLLTERLLHLINRNFSRVICDQLKEVQSQYKHPTSGPTEIDPDCELHFFCTAKGDILIDEDLIEPYSLSDRGTVVELSAGLGTALALTRKIFNLYINSMPRNIFSISVEHGIEKLTHITQCIRFDRTIDAKCTELIESLKQNEDR